MLRSADEFSFSCGNTISIGFSVSSANFYKLFQCRNVPRYACVTDYLWIRTSKIQASQKILGFFGHFSRKTHMNAYEKLLNCISAKNGQVGAEFCGLGGSQGLECACEICEWRLVTTRVSPITNISTDTSALYVGKYLSFLWVDGSPR